METEKITLGSFSSSKSSVFFCFVLLLLGASLGLSAQPAARKLLPETAVLDRVDGKITHVDANDTWLFELTMEVKTPDYALPVGTRFVLLPSATLGQLVADVNDRFTPRYRLSARVTLYRGQNYLFPTYWLPLSKFKDDQNPQDSGQKAEGGAANPPSAIRNPQSDVPELTLPPEVLEHLKKQRPLRGPRRDAASQKKPGAEVPDHVLVDCVGRIEKRKGAPVPPASGADRAAESGQDPSYPTGLVLTPYALGWNVGEVRYELLPCRALEQVLQMQTRALEPLRFSVAGLVAEFQGKKYLLLQRAVIVYNYGNFGR